MKTIYKGHEISVERDKCLAGYSLLYVSVFRVKDGFECTSFYLDTEDTPKTLTRAMKSRIDGELASEDPWGENAS